MTTSEPATAAPRWRAALPLDELAPGAMTAWKHEGRSIVLARTPDGEVHALDNRCPHEGYPLHTGELDDAALTCCWHNWKFDVRSGACLLGEEGVRSFPVRVNDGTVEVDLSEPPPEATWPARLASFDRGLGEHQIPRAARDGVRLIQAGYPPEALLARVALYDARHAEYGCTHALPAAADCGRFLERYAGADAMYAIAPAVDMCGQSCRRLPPRAPAPPLEGADGETLRAAVEAEDAARAEGLLRGAFRAGVPRAEVERWLYRVLADHFRDFGHGLIYLVKAQELFDRAGDEHAEEIHAALLYGIVHGTREDTLPYMRGYFRRLEERADRLQGWHAGAGRDPDAGADALRDAVLDGSLDEAADALFGALDAGASLGALARALVAAAAHRFFRFDVAVDADPGVMESWISVTHRLTFASAVRNAVERYDEPDAIRFLLQAVAFVHGGRAMDAPPERRLAVEPREASAEEVVAAIARRDAAAAVGGAAFALADPERAEALRVALEDLALQDPLVRPIVVVHAIKTLLAAFEERAALAGHPDRDRPVLATVRFLASPVRERRVHEQVRRSIDWVDAGIIPRKLTQ